MLSEAPRVPAQILICVDEHLQIGDCTYECIGALPPSSSCGKCTQPPEVSRHSSHEYMSIDLAMFQHNLFQHDQRCSNTTFIMLVHKEASADARGPRCSREGLRAHQLQDC